MYPGRSLNDKVLCDRYRKVGTNILSSSTFPGQSYWFKKVNTGSVSSSREESPGSWKERFRKVSNSRGISFRLCLKGMVYKDTVLKRKNSSSRNFPSSTREYRSLTECDDQAQNPVAGGSNYSPAG